MRWVLIIIVAVSGAVNLLVFAVVAVTARHRSLLLIRPSRLLFDRRCAAAVTRIVAASIGIIVVGIIGVVTVAVIVIDGQSSHNYRVGQTDVQIVGEGEAAVVLAVIAAFALVLETQLQQLLLRKQVLHTVGLQREVDLLRDLPLQVAISDC